MFGSPCGKPNPVDEGLTWKIKSNCGSVCFSKTHCIESVIKSKRKLLLAFQVAQTISPLLCYSQLYHLLEVIVCFYPTRGIHLGSELKYDPPA